MKQPVAAAITLSAALLLGACSKTGTQQSGDLKDAASPIAAPAADGQIDMIAREFSFEIPTITAGNHQMQLINEGQQAHMAIILRLEEGKTAEDVMGYIAENGFEGRPPSWASRTAGGFADPGTTAPIGAMTNKGDDPLKGVDFIAGNYVAMCFIADGLTGLDQTPEKGAKSHAELGMVNSFTVA